MYYKNLVSSVLIESIIYLNPYPKQMSTTSNLDCWVTSCTQHETLTGVVERLTYHSPESGYSVARLKPVGNRDLITIVGTFANLQAGQNAQVSWYLARTSGCAERIKLPNIPKRNPLRSQESRNIDLLPKYFLV